jgi:serine/threonine protein kinase/WD40 repeat protein
MTTPPTGSPQDVDPAFAELVDRLTARLQAGEVLDPEACAREHPAHAEQLRRLLPALHALAEVGPVSEDVAAITSAPQPAPPRLLGDYRILRQIGKGGMGEVYEAVQQSLGRHVALKVLPPLSALTPLLLERFRREAKAAARLHHTNIVPVFGVGEHEGVHFYAMQYIEGQGLNQVLEQVKRLRRQACRSLPAGSLPSRPEVLARGLLTDCFPRWPTDPAATDAGGRGPASASAGRGDNAAPAPAADPTPVLRPGGLPGPDSISDFTGTTESHYFRSVARVGVQVAGGLDYAHRQGVLHRDVKPSNLLLDTHGRVWITDFGLAKVEGADDLTGSGDVVGTLRYMAPERFRGQADARGDVYSLGLTLYEMLTLRHPFEDEDRARLLRRIQEEVPPRPRRLDPHVPRDLETIVLRAVEKEPGKRYQSAAELAEDLQRFLDGEPVRARPVGFLGQTVRWARRRPAVAALLGALLLALLVLLALGAWSYWNVRRALDEKGQALIDKELERAAAVRAREEEKTARELAERETYRAPFHQTQLLRAARQPGWRAQALENLRRLVQLSGPRRDLVELRSEAVACLSEPDVREVRTLVGNNQFIHSLDFNPDGTLLAAASQGGLLLWDVASGRRLRAVADDTAFFPPRLPHPAPWPAVRFSPDGHFLAYAGTGARVFTLPAREGGDPQALVSGNSPARFLSFDGRGRHLAVGWSDQRAVVYDVAMKAVKAEFPAPVANGREAGFSLPVALSPDGGLLAAPGPENAVQVHPVGKGGNPVVLGRHQEPLSALCFSPEGDLLASAAGRTIKLWDPQGRQEELVIRGHADLTMGLAFSPDGRLLLSSSQDRSARLWDTRTGQQLFRLVTPSTGAASHAAAFSPTGERFAVAARTVDLYELTGWRERQQLLGHAGTVFCLGEHPRRPLLASGGRDGNVILWDLAAARARPLRRWSTPANQPVTAVAFSPDGAWLAAAAQDIATADQKVYVYETETGVLRSRLLVKADLPFVSLVFAPSGRRLAAGSVRGLVVVSDPATGEELRRWQIQQDAVRVVAFLREETQLLTAGLAGPLLVVEIAGFRLRHQARVQGAGTGPAVVPGGGALALADREGGVRILTIPELRETRKLPGVFSPGPANLSFSPDGRLVLAGTPDGRISLRDGRTFAPLLSFPPESAFPTCIFCAGGQRVAVHSRDRQITLYDLAAIRAHLASLGIDWETSAP